MDLDFYQGEAQKTDRVPAREGEAGKDVIVPLLGLAGEAGELLSEYKKFLRDGSSHRFFEIRLAEELGDLLWYVANVATKFNLKLSGIAQQNLEKTRDRWLSDEAPTTNFDAGFPEEQRFPRQFEAELLEVVVEGRKKIRLTIDGIKTGDDLTDNADDPDGYRFHDVFHLAYVAVLGWSPVIRKFMKRKRRKDPRIDENQDGGRAQVLDEAVAALAFDYASKHDWLNNVPDLDFLLLRKIRDITSILEVKACSLGDWQKAILAGFSVWRKVRDNNGGRIFVDLDARQISYLGPPQPGNSAAEGKNGAQDGA